MTSEAGLLDICDRQAKLAASLNRRKPSARDQQDAESQAHRHQQNAGSQALDATSKPSRSLRTSETSSDATSKTSRPSRTSETSLRHR